MFLKLIRNNINRYREFSCISKAMELKTIPLMEANGDKIYPLFKQLHQTGCLKIKRHFNKKRMFREFSVHTLRVLKGRLLKNVDC
jgi:hypothetical protein